MDLMQMCVNQDWCYSKLPLVFNICAMVCSLVVFATFAAKLTPTTKDDEIVGSVKKYWLKFLALAPTFGTNPQTKAMMDQLQAKAEDKKE